MRLLDEGRARDALQIGETLVSSGDDGDRLSGYLCRGLAYEEGGADLAVDIEKSIYSYRQAELIAPDSLSWNYLARASMKKEEGSGYPDAWKYLQKAAKIAVTSEVLLGFAAFYRTKPDKDLEKAKEFYLRAALHGRFAGFFGYSEVARELGQDWRANGVACMRVMLGPIIALLIGARAQDRF